MHRAHERSMLVQQIPERAITKGDLHRLLAGASEARGETRPGEPVLQRGEVRAGRSFRARSRRGPAHQVRAPLARELFGRVTLLRGREQAGQDVGEQLVVSTLARLYVDRHVQGLWPADRRRRPAGLPCDQADLLQTAEVRPEGVRMQRQASRQLADGDRAPGEPEVPVQAVARVLPGGPVYLDCGRLRPGGPPPETGV